MLDRLYRSLLYLYPSHYRQEYGAEMARLFHDRRRAESPLLVCLEALPDLLIGAWREHMDTLRRDIAYALRACARNPGFASVVLITLALGIGANTAVFSVVKGVVLDPLPYKDPGRLVRVYEKRLKQGRVRNVVSAPDFVDWRKQNTVFESMAAVNGAAFSFTKGDRAHLVRGASVTLEFFGMLGVKPALGRDFLPEEQIPGKDRVLILSHGLWKREFGGDTAIAGRIIHLSGEAFEIVGVLPDIGNVIGPDVEMWQPLVSDGPLPSRRAHFLDVYARLRPGITIAQAGAEMDLLAGRIEAQFPDENTGHGVNVFSLQEEVTGPVRPALFMLMGAVGLVLLVACANVANLFIARTAQRQREISIRTALGAGAGRLARQLLTESILLSLLGGAAGAVLAYWGVRALVAANPGNLPRLTNVRLDGEVLLFSCIVAILTGLLFGLAPAFHLSRGRIADALKQGGRISANSTRTRQLLLVSEIALAVVLVVGSGLMLRSFARLASVHPGFDASNVLTLDVPLMASRYSKTSERLQFHSEMMAGIARLPGVSAVGSTNALPMSGRDNGSNLVIAGRPPVSYSQLPHTRFGVVTPGYFPALRIPLRAGRFLGSSDHENAPLVVLINETLARQYWPDENPIGRRVALAQEKIEFREIVGIVADVKHSGLGGESPAEMYSPYAQQPQANMTVVVRTAGDPETLIGGVRSVVRGIDRDQPLARIQPLEALVERSVAQPRLYSTLLAIFSALALVLAAVGIYGVLSFGVAQRSQEMGVRMALGAGAGAVLKLIMKEGLTLTAAGISIGIAGALALTRVLGKLLYGIEPTDPATFAGAIILIVLTAATACYLPARRATRVDPVIALRAGRGLCKASEGQRPGDRAKRRKHCRCRQTGQAQGI